MDHCRVMKPDGERERRMRSMLMLVEQVIELPEGAGTDLLRRLATATAVLAAAARQAASAGDTARAAMLDALGEQVGFVRASVDPLGSVREVREGLSRLRRLTTLSDLVANAPGELARLGYSRTLVSRVARGEWITRAASSRAAPEIAEALLAAGQEPRRLDGSVVETEMVRSRRTLFIRDAQRRGGVRHDLIAITGTEAYVAAPVTSHGSVVGLVHADRDPESGLVGPDDRELVGSFAEGFGLALERAWALHRLRELRTRLHDQLQSVSELIDEFEDFAGVESPLGPPPQADTARAAPASTPIARWSLTPREAEVLALMAEGKTNTEIAVVLFVSETTVKYHVRNVLRKTGAANRADATARYHRSRPDG